MTLVSISIVGVPIRYADFRHTSRSEDRSNKAMATAALPTAPAYPQLSPDVASSTERPTATSDQPSTIPITVTFLGGLAPLFANNTTHTIQLPSTQPAAPSIAHLISHLAQQFLSKETGTPQSKRDMFVPPDSDRTVRPGILVLVNEADWELLGEGEAELESGDEVVFVSTLHGG